VTWVDGQGRQYVLADGAFAFGSTPPSPYQLFVARDRADGEPDATWGAGGSNRRLLSPAPPAEGATLDRIAAATSDGTITLVWDAPGCASTSTCDRWFERIDATGATVAAPVLVDDLAPPFQALGDGSVLTGTGTGPLGWYGPDGADRGAPAVEAATVKSAAVDADGRLLLATAEGTVRRWPIAGPSDLTLDSSCAGADGIAIGSSVTAGDGFAVACSSTDDPVSVTRYGDGGSVAWTASDTAAPESTSHLRAPTDLAVTTDGTVWVGGGGVLPISAAFPISATQVASFTQAGTVTRHYERPTIRPGSYDQGVTGVSELRPVDATHVAVADIQRCCFTIEGMMPESSVTGQVLPLRPAPPACNRPAATIAAATASTLDVHFTTCAEGEPNRAPTGYRVEVASTAGTVTNDVPAPAASTSASTTVAGVPAGHLLTVTVVPHNALGDTVGNETAPARTVAPFRTVDAFAARPYDEGGCGLVGLAEGDAQRALVTAGTLAPEDHIANILQRCEAEHRIEPVARLYQAALLRAPDTTGLRYWVARSRNGVQLRVIASQFAGSPEFKRRYGTLTNRRYVERIYQNVLGRAGDATGIAFWTKRLDTRKETRGGVLAGFSESSEHVRRTDPLVQPAAAWFLMLDRAPTAAEQTTIAAFDRPRQDAALAIMALPEYAARVG